MPKIVDYACGAGHFLTEAIEAVNAYFNHIGKSEMIENNAWVEKCIFGVEKDYRLARVSKVSLFMNGAGQARIIFGDGLECYPEKGIENGKFDVLVANPPYSVDAFKSHLTLKNNQFEILDYVTNNGSEIETLFVERIAQLLKPRGIAAVVLPSSILSNSNPTSYMKAREHVLKNFFIRAIVCFGGKTFGATSTSTPLHHSLLRDGSQESRLPMGQLPHRSVWCCLILPRPMVLTQLKSFDWLTACRIILSKRLRLLNPTR